MTATEIITSFETQVSDVTELSTSEELALLNRVYQRVCNDRPWEFLKATATGTITNSGSSYYLTLPDDFAYFYENFDYTDNAISTQINSGNRVVLVGSNYAPYYIVNYADRGQYRNRGGYAYLDIANNRLYFTGPTSGTYELNYIKVPETLTASDEPVFPARFQDILVYGMAVENDIIQLSDKAKSYAPENQELYNQYLADMALWNSNLQNY